MFVTGRSGFGVSCGWRLARGFAVILVLVCRGSVAAAAADEGPMACVKDIGAPQFPGKMEGLPARVEVTVKVGAEGTAESVDSSSGVKWINTEMRLTFMSQAKYVDACQGKTLKFVVSYVPEGTPMDRPVSRTAIRMPNEFIVRYRPLLPAAK